MTLVLLKLLEFIEVSQKKNDYYRRGYESKILLTRRKTEILIRKNIKGIFVKERNYINDKQIKQRTPLSNKEKL